MMVAAGDSQNMEKHKPEIWGRRRLFFCGFDAVFGCFVKMQKPSPDTGCATTNTRAGAGVLWATHVCAQMHASTAMPGEVSVMI